MRGTIDQNRNRLQDRTEAWDTVRVSAPLATPLQLLTAPRDTLPARIQGVALTDSTTLNVTFDRLLDPTQPFPAASFRLPPSATIQRSCGPDDAENSALRHR